MIHGAIYEAHSDVDSVVHNHAYPLLPFGITGRALEPMVHAPSVIGSDVPIWDIAAEFSDTDMLVRTMDQGRDLAARPQLLCAHAWARGPWLWPRRSSRR